MASYIRTRLATGWREDDRSPGSRERPVGLVRGRTRANPSYGPAMHRVVAWLVEFPDEDPTVPWREIGVDAEGEPVLAGPTEDDLGFWLDTSMGRSDFHDAEEVPASLFERLWARFFTDHPGLTPLD